MGRRYGEGKKDKDKNLKPKRYKKWRIVNKEAGRMERLEINGDPLGKKREVLGSFIFDNCNCSAPWYTRNQKILIARNL